MSLQDKLERYTFDYGNAYKTRIALDMTILTKAKDEAEFDDCSWQDPFSYTNQESYFQSICKDYGVDSIDSIDFKLTYTDISKPLIPFLFDENDKPKESLFELGLLTAHAQEVVNSYANCFDIDEDETLLELLDKISEVYVGKYKSSADYAETEVNNFAFGVKVPSSLKQYIDFEEMALDMEDNLYIDNEHYFRNY